LLNDITYSILAHIETEVSELTDVVQIYDGVTLTNRMKPFGTIEQMPSSIGVIAKERSYYEKTYRYQIGLYAQSLSQRMKLEEAIEQALLQPNISLLNTSQFPPAEAGFFYCDVLATTPMPAESPADETNKHKVYFDVEVYTEFRNGDNTFKQ
jgi:hypothetical protein